VGGRWRRWGGPGGEVNNVYTHEYMNKEKKIKSLWSPFALFGQRRLVIRVILKDSTLPIFRHVLLNVNNFKEKE
jgi:hypothetical protein